MLLRLVSTWVFYGDPCKEEDVTVRFIYIYKALLRHVAVCGGRVSQSMPGVTHTMRS
jgi:hypothetical protein